MDFGSSGTTVIVGLGNTLRSDDAVGIYAVRELARVVDPRLVRIRESMRGGLDLLELMAGFEKAHLVDAIVTRKASAGHVWQLDLEDLPPSLTLATSHEVDLPTALALGEQLGLELPPHVTVWGIEVIDPYTISENLSPAVEKAIPHCIHLIQTRLSAGTDPSHRS